MSRTPASPGRPPRPTVSDRVHAAILDVVSHDTVLMGTVDSLARGLGVTVMDLRFCLRELLDAGWISVRDEPRGRLTIRLERRSY